MQRRRSFLKGVAGGGALLLVLGAGGCGFHLRQSPAFGFRKLWLGGSSRIVEDIKNYLRDVRSDIVIVSSPKEAEVLLEIESEQRREIIVGQTPAGQIREKQLRLVVTFKMWEPGKDPESSRDMLEQFRESSYSETLALAKSEEETLLFNDMCKSIAQQLVWRLSAMQH